MVNNRFKKIVEITLGIETEEVDDPRDSGGYTKWGFAQKWNMDIDVHALDKDKAIERYYQRYWMKPRIDTIDNDAIAQKIFDCGVYMGSRRLVRILQKSVNDTKQHGIPPLNPDGILGSITTSAVNNHPNPDYLLERIKVGTVKKICTFSNRTFLVGWIIRAISDVEIY